MGDAMMNSDISTPEERKGSSSTTSSISSPPPPQPPEAVSSPKAELEGTSTPPAPPPPLLPKMEPPVPLHQPDPMSLARLHFLNAYSRWPVPPPTEIEEYRVRWEDHANNLLQQVAKMEQDPASADVTVATKGFTLPAHRIVLAAASKFFSSVLQRVPVGQHPVIVIRDALPKHLKCVINFCYSGSVTIPSQDVQHVVKLAEDLEIYGLRVSCLTGSGISNSKSLSSISSTHTPSAPPPPSYHHQTGPGTVRQRFLYGSPSSPKRFTFTPIQNASSSSSSSSLHFDDDLQKEKKLKCPAHYYEPQGRKRFKGTPIPVGREGGTPPSSLPHSSTTPPGSAPPILPSTSFFRRNPPSPPNSAPPHSASSKQLPHPGELQPSSSLVKKESTTALSLVSPSQLLEPISHPSSSSPPQRSGPPSPLSKTEPLSPSSFQVPSTPNSLALALTEPMTPSTPNTPTTPSLINGESSNSNRMGVGCNTSGCSTGSRVLLWRFLLDLLHSPHYSPIYIRWLDRAAGIFRIMESDMVAQLWGMARKNTNMNYEKMSRGMRTYYKRGILFHIDGTKLIYKFNINDPEIQQRMRYYDLTLRSPEGSEATSDQQSSSNHVSSPTLSSHLSNLPSLPSLPNLPVSVTSSSTTSTIDSLYSNPFLRDISQLQNGLLYDPYITSFLRASHRELF